MADTGQEAKERKEEAVAFIYEQLVDGVPTSRWRPGLSEYGVCDRTIRRWITEAETKLGAEAGLLRISYLGRSLSRLEFLWRWALEDGDRAEARKIEKDIREMLGLNEAVEIKHLIPNAWHSMFDTHGIRRPGNGKGNGAGGGNGKDEPPQVRN